MRINNKKYLKNLLTRFLIMIIFILFILILNKYNKSLALNLKNNLFNKSINFVKINKLSQRLLGKDVFYYQSKESDSMVIASQFNQNKKNKYFDGEKILVSSNLPIGSISSGVVVYIGNKENYNNTIIIQGMDGYNIWYGNITNVNASLYDYVEEHSLIGSADGEYMYLLIEKDNKFYTYDEYVKSKN
ncbi:MAG: M23 family metallopeptidase [Bacilli bacterium]|nr:M23 family metallopeptidase [Bacilli bacterium]